MFEDANFGKGLTRGDPHACAETDECATGSISLRGKFVMVFI